MPSIINKTKVRFSREEVAKFRGVWPCSNLRDRSYWFEFTNDGNLVDTDVPEQDHGEAAAALADDAKGYFWDDVVPAWL